MSRRFGLRALGPGLAIAATGVGAGDLLAAMLAGAEVGTVLLWAIAVGAILKFALNEGIARWQLATGETFLEGWFARSARLLQVYFLLYLVVWGFVVAAGLMSACGVAAQALTGVGSVAAWSMGHSVAAAVLVLVGRYALFENVMRGLIAFMFVTLVGSVAFLAPDPGELAAGLLVPRMPSGSAGLLVGLMGGVGGSVTMLSYGYWIRERHWTGPEHRSWIRWDLGVGYLLTGIFGMAVLVLAAVALEASTTFPAGSQGLVVCADAVAEAATPRLGESGASLLRLVFLAGVWGAVATSTLGVWQGVPYLFADAWGAFRREPAGAVDPRGRRYRLALLYLALPPMVLLVADRPVWVIRLYTITSGLFMPLLAASLLWMNGRRAWVGELRHGWAARLALGAALVLFALVLFRKGADLL